jgi:tripartite-type tricarboxylate transporter receptor subunit TctC
MDHARRNVNNPGRDMQEGVMNRLAIIMLGCTLAAAAPAPASAQDYPGRPVTFVVPFAPGGATDLFARLIGQKLEQRLGKPFVIDNRPGSGGVTAAAAVARAAPDGYTIMMASSTVLAINVTVRKSLPYDPRKDLQPLALLARVPFVLVVNNELPVRSVDDLVKLARSQPGKISFATPGPGTSHHLNAELFSSIFGLKLVMVPYKGTAPALQDVVAGHVQMMFSDVPPAKALIESGKVRALGVTTAQRVPALPSLPPLAEVGVPNYDAASWHTVTTTAGVPAPVVDKLHGALRAIMAEPAVIEQLSKEGTLPQTSPSPEELKRFVESEIVRWGEVVRKAGIAGSE